MRDLTDRLRAQASEARSYCNRAQPLHIHSCDSWFTLANALAEAADALDAAEVELERLRSERTTEVLRVDMARLQGRHDAWESRAKELEADLAEYERRVQDAMSRHNADPIHSLFRFHAQRQERAKPVAP